MAHDYPDDNTNIVRLSEKYELKLKLFFEIS
jgi:hypothetical protein